MKKVSILALLCLFMASCSSFITKEHDEQLKTLEAYQYTMRKDVTVEKRSIAKNKVVKLRTVYGEDYVKVYAYPVSVNTLKAEHVLLIYLFEEDFPDSKFNFDYVVQRLNEFVVRR